MAKKKYIQDEGHFINFINCILADTPHTEMKLLSAQEYIRRIYRTGIADDFTWDLRKDVSILDAENINRWIEKNNNPPPALSYKTEEFQPQWIREIPFSDDFNELCKSLIKISGVYCFWHSSANKPLYVGKSVSLGERLITSYTSKYQQYKLLPTQASVIEMGISDAGIYELYFISTLNPVLNIKDKTGDKMTLKLSPMFEFGIGTTVLKDEDDG